MKKVFSAFVFAALAIPAIAQQSPQFGEQVDVNVVLVDTVVTDKAGHQILGLDKDDFIIKENGVAQAIDSVEYFTNRRLLSGPEGSAAFKVERVHQERYFIVFVDKTLQMNNRPGANSELLRLRDSVDRFIDKQMLPDDRLAIVGYDARLKVYSDFTADKNVLKTAMVRSIGFGRGIDTVGMKSKDSIFSTLDADTLINRTGTMYDAVRVLADATHGIHAKKALLMFSPGVWDPDRAYPDIDRIRYDKMVHALNASNVSVYAINSDRNRTYRQAEMTLGGVSADTGGDYYRFPVSFDLPLQKVENTNNGYYLITYTSRHPKGTNGYQKISVTLRNPEFRVRSREGYSY